MVKTSLTKRKGEKFLIRRFFATLLCAFCLTASAAIARAPTDAGASLEAQRAFDERVATIGHRLAVANLDLCTNREPRPGIMLHDLVQYRGSEAAAISAYGPLDRGPGVLALARGGPAQRGGLQRDDIILAVDGSPLSGNRGRRFEAIEPLLELFERSFDDGRASLSVLRDNQPMTLVIEAEPGCSTRFQVVTGRSPDARADGVYVQIQDGISRYVRDDSELASVIAHEFAHNVLAHRARLDALQVRRGLAANFGRNATYIRESEIEADRLSVYLMQRAGYDPQAAVRFWSNFGRRGLNFLTSPTHPGWRQRMALFEQEIQAIHAARAAGIVPVPDFLPSRPNS